MRNKWTGLAQTLFSTSKVLPEIPSIELHEASLDLDEASLDLDLDEMWNAVSHSGPEVATSSLGGTSASHDATRSTVPLSLMILDTFQGARVASSWGCKDSKALPEEAGTPRSEETDTPRSLAHTPLSCEVGANFQSAGSLHAPFPRTRQSPSAEQSPRSRSDSSSSNSGLFNSSVSAVLQSSDALQTVSYFRRQVRLGSFWAEILLRAEAQKLFRAAISHASQKELSEAIVWVSRAAETGMTVEDAKGIVEQMKQKPPCWADDEFRWQDLSSKEDEDLFVHAFLKYFGLKCEECNTGSAVEWAEGLSSDRCVFCELDATAGCVEVTSELLERLSKADLSPCITCTSRD
mmetsp:Transcript_25701/g.59272  ORF Transcript_25701/g.59272 Transcript_25701/m.59272 type:complete len:349 (-) Transcript_25701:95-1141(-)